MTDLAKTYDPQATEARWQQGWEESGAFHPDPKAPGEPFSVVIPPPNVTGSLHMGHAFNTALIDTIVRFQRLQGKNVLCLPKVAAASWVSCAGWAIRWIGSGSASPSMPVAVRR